MLLPSRAPLAPQERAPGPMRQVTVLVALGVILDQVTKAVAHDVLVNEGGTGYVLPDTVRLLWQHPHVGAVLDLVDVVPLLIVAAVATRSAAPTTRVGWSLICAGCTSNWADRIGLAALTHPGSARGAVDWLRVPGVPGVYNLADLLIVAGGLTLVAVVLARGARSRRLVAGTATLCLLAVWVGVWSGDRRATESAARANRLEAPIADVVKERHAVADRIHRARAVARQADRQAAKAALVARRSGVPEAALLLAPDQDFACQPSKRHRCVVVQTVADAVTVVYPVHLPRWAVRLGLPPGMCDVVVDQVGCALAASPAREAS